MAIFFATSTPKKLLASFKNAIDEERVTDWAYDADGDFTHTSKQCINKAWLHPEFDDECLSVFTLPPKNGNVSQDLYAKYQGLFLGAMITHCHSLFTQGTATASPTSKDLLKGADQNTSIWK